MFNPANWGWPQWVMIVYLLACVVISVFKHGTVKVGEKPIDIIVRVGTQILRIVVLIAGGFFAAFHWPQIVSIVLAVIYWSAYIKGLPSNRDRVIVYRFTTNFFATAFTAALYIFGGFFA